MKIALVLDAREPLDATASANLQALLLAFAGARDPSDKLSLFAAGVLLAISAGRGGFLRGQRGRA